MTVEEHSIIGGLGGAVAEVLAEQAPTKMLRIGVNDTFGESGPAKALIEKYGLDANRFGVIGGIMRRTFVGLYCGHER